MNELLLEKLFGSRLRVAVFSLFFSRPGEEFYPGEIADLTKENRSNITRELLKLEQLGILRSRIDKRRLIRVHYTLNPDFLLYNEIKSIFLKTTGAVGVLKHALANVTGIDYAFIYGSVASGNEGPSSDIDLMIIGSIPLEALSRILKKPEEILGRDMNPSVYSLEEFKNRLMKVDPFMSKIMDEPRMMLVEKDDELQKIIR